MGKKSKSKLIRFSEKDLEVIREKAEKADLKVGTYIRQMAVDGEVRVFELAVVSDLIMSMNRIGANINQIATVVNSTHRVYKNDFEALQKELQEIKRNVNYCVKCITGMK